MCTDPSRREDGRGYTLLRGGSRIHLRTIRPRPRVLPTRVPGWVPGRCSGLVGESEGFTLRFFWSEETSSCHCCFSVPCRYPDPVGGTSVGADSLGVDGGRDGGEAGGVSGAVERLESLFPESFTRSFFSNRLSSDDPIFSTALSPCFPPYLSPSHLAPTLLLSLFLSLSFSPLSPSLLPLLCLFVFPTTSRLLSGSLGSETGARGP